MNVSLTKTTLSAGLTERDKSFYKPLRFRISSRMASATSALLIRGSSRVPSGGDEGDHVGVHPKACTGHLEVVCHHHVQILPGQFGGRVSHNIPGLHGKTAEELVGLSGADGTKNVGGALHGDGEVAVLLFDLVVATVAGR